MNAFPFPVRRTEDSAQFFDMAAQGEVMIRRCLNCEALRAAQNAVCITCHSIEWEPVAADKAGAILVTWTVVHRSPVPGLTAPYTAAIVECAEGPWMFVRLLEAEDRDLHEGMPVELITAQTGEQGESIVAARPKKVD